MHNLLNWLTMLASHLENRNLDTLKTRARWNWQKGPSESYEDVCSSADSEKLNTEWNEIGRSWFHLHWCKNNKLEHLNFFVIVVMAANEILIRVACCQLAATALHSAASKAHEALPPYQTQRRVVLLASCLIYSYAFKEYISSFGCWSNGHVLFCDVTFSEIGRRKGALFLYSPWKMLK